MLARSRYFLIHYFFPHESNNHKAKLLHAPFLVIIIVAFIFFQFVLQIMPRFGVNVLGYAANISPEEVIRLTNQKRIEAGLAPLQYSASLSQAALAKATDMINDDYWAHVAPDGTQPWKFFLDVGYRYRFAGENLARDFPDATSAVEAWMASQSHRENILSPKYEEIGVGVVEGDLNGVDTTIIVQFFGTRYTGTPAVPVAKAELENVAPTPTFSPSPAPLVGATSKPQQIAQGPATENGGPTGSRVLISPFKTTKGISIAVVGILLTVLVVDGIVVSRRGIVRIGARTFAHIAFLGMILAVVIILKAGQII